MPIFKKIILLIGDILALLVALACAMLIRYETKQFAQHFIDHIGPFIPIFMVWLIVLYLADLYRHDKFKNQSILLGTLATAVVIATTISIILFYLFGDSFFKLTPKTNLFIFSALFLVLDYLWRRLATKAFVSGATNIILIGNSPLIAETATAVEQNPQSGYRLTAWQKEASLVHENNVKNLLTKHTNIAVVAPQITKNVSAAQFIYQLITHEINIMSFFDFYEIVFEKEPLEELNEEWFIDNIIPHRPFYDGMKRIIDIFLGSTLLIIFSPIALLITIIMPFTTRKGSIIYAQKRIGKNGKFFTLYKFGTMSKDDEGPLWTEQKDVRLTGFGALLRFTHLDELPQLWNILKGDISFTGPRPERIELTEQYKKIPYYEMRHVIKPGLTGWAQINYKPSASLEEAFEKLKYDIYYVKNRSLFLDFVIILRTVKYVFTSYRKQN